MFNNITFGALLLAVSSQIFAADTSNCHYGNKLPACINKSLPINEVNYKADYKTDYETYVNYYGKIDSLNGYVPMSKKSIDHFISQRDHSNWLANGVRFFKPYQKVEGYWLWKIEPVKYNGLTVVGLYRGVCDDYISGEDRCGSAADTGFLFKESSKEVREKIKFTNSSAKKCLTTKYPTKMDGKNYATVSENFKCII